MDRREKLLSGLVLAEDSGLEVGALDRPLVTKAMGPIFYVDYADAAFLRAKYADDPGVVVDQVVETDAVWGDRTIAEAVGDAAPFDYAIASHVVEHVPDLVAWFAELRSVLGRGGTLRLAVPDMRYTFDVLRQPSDLADVLTAHVLEARAPSPRQIIDSCLNHHAVDVRDLWRDGAAGIPRLPPRARFDHALACARLVRDTGQYIDVHCWTFTPESFADIMEQLSALGLLRFAAERCFATERDSDEFIVILRAEDDPEVCAASWRDAGRSLAAVVPAVPVEAPREGDTLLRFWRRLRGAVTGGGAQ